MPIRVLVVDDSAYNRQAIQRMLESHPEIRVVGTARDGEEAMAQTLRLRPDLITLDLEMPRMDGFTFLRWVMATRPMPVLVVSARSDDRSILRALELGAVDFVAKPTAGASARLLTIQEDLVEKISSVAGLEIRKLQASLRLSESAALHPPREVTEAGMHTSRTRMKHLAVVAIGASTGGPPAIQAILQHLPASYPSAVLVTQHMPSGFTRHFAERLNKGARVEVCEAAEGDLIQAGRVLITPGGFHLGLKRQGKEVRTTLIPREGRDRYVPSADVMLRSAATTYGSRTLGVLLTGMGNDGTEGLRAVKAAGGETWAESEESAVIFGMPAEAIRAGVVDRVLPLSKIVEEVAGWIPSTGRETPGKAHGGVGSRK